MRKLGQQFQDMSTATKKSTSPPWRALAWIGSFGLGLSAFLSVASHLHFQYQSLKDIVATPAFLLYPEHQDWWLYLLSLAIVPTFTLAGYGIWGTLAAQVRRMSAGTSRSDLAFVTLTYLLWWLDPLTYAMAQHRAALPAYAVGGLFLAANGLLVTQRWLECRARSTVREAPPPLALQGAIALLGAGVGASWLTSPLATPLLKFPLFVVLGAAVGLWSIWLGGAYLMGRRLGRGWLDTAQRLAAACLPLSILPLQAALWLQVRQEGVLVAGHRSPITWGLPLVAVAASIGMAFWMLRRRAASRRYDRLFRQGFLLLSVPLLLYALVYNPNIHWPLDLFHEGERVSSAQALMAGGTPYQDIVFVHGFGLDPGVALAAFRLFGVSVAAERMLNQLLIPLSLVATYYLALVCLGGGWALVYSALALTAFWPLFWGWRIVPAVVTFICLVLYIRRRRLYWALGAGLGTFVAMAISFDVGTITLAAAGTMVVTFSIVKWQEVRWHLFLGYSLPLAFCISGVVVYFASVGALASFVDWHKEILSVYRDWNGMPFPMPPGSLSQAWESLLSPLASIVTAAILLLSIVRRKWGTWHWILLLLLVANVTLFNRGLVSGYETGSALITGSHFAPLLLLVILRSWTNRTKLSGPVLAALLGVALILPIPTQPPTGQSLLDVVRDLPAKNRIEIPASWVQSGIERVGPLFLPAEQVTSLTEVLDAIGQESFWDFTDHGALYFLSDHLSPTRFYTAHHVITRENQLEVIHDLARTPPRFVLFRSGTGWDAIAGIDRTLRSFLVSEYLLDNYHLAGQAGGFTILEVGAPSGPQDLSFRVDLGYVPFLWGRDRIDELAGLQLTVKESWNMTQGAAGWEAANDVSPAEETTDGWRILTTGTDPYVQDLALDLDPASITYVALRMRVEGVKAEGARAQLFWRSNLDSFAEEKSVLFDVVPDGQEHTYLLRLASFPGWAWSGPISGIRLDPVDTANATVTIHSIELVYVPEVGETLEP